MLKAGEKAPSVKAHEVQHECGALKCMSLYHRARVDAATRWMHRDALGDAPVNYFKSLMPQYGEYLDEERMTLQDDAKARKGGYEGPSPHEAKLTEEEQTACTAAISAAMSQRKRGGKELVAKAEAGDETAQAESKRKAQAGSGSAKGGT